MTKNENFDQKRTNALLFINAAKDMLSKEDLNQISIRKLAYKTGLHNSTLYLYFDDLDELLMLASVRYFEEYSQRLAALSQKALSITENFLLIWDYFLTSILKNPKIFYNFFFGKRSNNLRKILNTYYDLFPEEKKLFSSIIETMYYGNNIKERCLFILKPLISEKGNAVTDKNYEMINQILVSCIKDMLKRKSADTSLDTDLLKGEMMNIIKYVCQIK